jgi:nucleoside-diphosphate-sugar epimerase
MKLLVTGANGFLGSEIIQHAVGAGIDVCGMDKGKASLSFSGIKHYPVDILELNHLYQPMKGIQSVIHTAGLAHVFNVQPMHEADFKAVNEEGSANVAMAAGKSGVRCLILISSVSLYGRGIGRGVDEDSPCYPEGPYAISKWQAERRAIGIAKATGMDLAILRLATAYGEGDPGNVGRLMRLIDRGKFVWIGSGSNQKSLIHKEDVARACLAVLLNQPRGINIYNVSAPPCTMKEVVEALAAALGRSIPRWHIPIFPALSTTYLGKKLSGDRSRLGNLYKVLKKWTEDDVYNTSRFEKEFNFETNVGLTEGLQREVAWYRGITP